MDYYHYLNHASTLDLIQVLVTPLYLSHVLVYREFALEDPLSIFPSSFAA